MAKAAQLTLSLQDTAQANSELGVPCKEVNRFPHETRLEGEVHDPTGLKMTSNSQRTTLVYSCNVPGQALPMFFH